MLRLFKKSLSTGIVTTGYPTEPATTPVGFRGLPIWQADLCQRCGHCAEVCLPGALKLDPTASDASAASFWSIDPKRCIFCGYCVEECSSQALIQGSQFELAEVAGVSEAKNAEPSTQIFQHSVHIRHLDAGSCNGCDWEMTTLTGPVYDVQRLGFDFVPSPRHADILMVTGPVTRNLEIAVQRTFQATPAPKLVVAVGSCACSGGICGKNYASAGGVDKILPVDVYIPGCPPRPQALIQGLLQAVKRKER